MKAVRVHGASGCYLGRMRRYPHFVGTLFETHRRWDGVLVWHNVGVHTTPRRSEREAVADAQELAQERGAVFLGLGPSLYNAPVVDDPHTLARWMGASIEDRRVKKVANILRAEKEHAKAVHDMLAAYMEEPCEKQNDEDRSGDR